MKIKRTSSEIILRLLADIDEKILDKVMQYFCYWEMIQRSHATSGQMNDLAEESKNELVGSQ
jgi:uncharacterized sporulation protein YeaH/YhbH (DUF444 family)